MTAYPIHPAAALMPEMTETEFQELVEDIRAKGLLQAIELHNGMIIDGRNRLRACREAGVEPRFTTISLHKELSAVDYVISRNLRRRHLTEGQREAIAAEAYVLLKTERKQRRDEKGHFVPVSPIGETVKEKDPNHRQRSIAARLGVSPRNVARAARVLENAPDVFQELKAGKITTTAADQTIAAREASKIGNPSEPTSSEPETKPVRLRAPNRTCKSCDALGEFYRQLRREVTRRRDANRDERKKRRWNPDQIEQRVQSDLLDWIEEQLDQIADANRKIRPRAETPSHNGKR